MLDEIITIYDIESILYTNAVDNENYLHGECQHFALALHEKTGYPLGAYINEDDCLIHAFVIYDNNNIIDIKGLRSVESMKDDFPEDGELADISKEALVYMTRDTLESLTDGVANANTKLNDVYALICKQIEFDKNPTDIHY